VKVSEQHLRPQQAHNASDRGACLASEEVRIGLLNRLVRARARCETPASLAEASTEQIKTMLDINEKFIAALPVCPPPPPEKPAVATAKPVPAPGKRRAASPPCLQIAPSRPEQYALTNRRCSGETVL